MISDNRNQGHHICTEKMQRCQGYVEALEEERRKIQVFQRELPLCVELVTQAIEACKQQLAVQTECSEQITSDGGPVLEEFIPIKRSTSSEEDDDDEVVDDDEQKSCRSEDTEKDKNFEKMSKKSDWLRSVQLWNQTPDPPTKQGSPKKVPMMELNKNGGGAFHPFKKGKVIDPTTTATKSPSPIPVAAAAAASSTGETGGGCNGGSGGGGSSSKKEEKEGQTQRKARRCWSPELHRRFLHALQQLGGSHVATPKQIRELMKVDGLTNDEVKSHLQKYRLHTRRPTPSTQNNSPQAPQYVVVGGIWVPPPEYAVAATTTLSREASGVSMPNTIYTPIAAPAVQKPHHKKAKQFHSDERPGSRGSSAGDRCSSPATSSSAHTSTASPAC